MYRSFASSENCSGILPQVKTVQELIVITHGAQGMLNPRLMDIISQNVLLMSLRKSDPRQNRQLSVYYY